MRKKISGLHREFFLEAAEKREAGFIGGIGFCRGKPASSPDFGNRFEAVS